MVVPFRNKYGTCLHDTPDTTNFAKGDAYFSKGFAARIPPVIRDGDGAAIPAARAATSFAFIGQVMQERTARLV